MGAVTCWVGGGQCWLQVKFIWKRKPTHVSVFVPNTHRGLWGRGVGVRNGLGCDTQRDLGLYLLQFFNFSKEG